MATPLRVFLLVLASGCSSFTMAGADKSKVVSATLVEACPLGVPWTRVRVADASDGIAVAFTSIPSKVAELQQRVRSQALVHGPNRHMGPGHGGEHGGKHGGPRDHGLQLWRLGDLATQVEDTSAGATLIVTPADPARRADVRQALVDRVAHLEKADCAD